MSIGGGYNTEAFVAAFYDHIPEYGERRDVEFYVGEALASDGPVLEVCCGTGRLLIPIARKRIHITGIDLSPYMLERCQSRIEAETGEVASHARIKKSDMRDFKLGEQYGTAIVPFRSFQHLTTVADQCACLTTIHRHLKPGAHLILDLFNPSLEVLTADNIGKELGPQTEFAMPDGSAVVRWSRFVSKDLSAQVNHMEMIYYVTHANGEKERLVHSFPMRYLFRYEVEHLLYRCGYELAAVYSDFDKNPFGSTDPGELIIVAKKPLQ